MVATLLVRDPLAAVVAAVVIAAVVVASELLLTEACWPPLGCLPTLPARAILCVRTEPKVLASADEDNDSTDSSAIGVTLPIG